MIDSIFPAESRRWLMVASVVFFFASLATGGLIPPAVLLVTSVGLLLLGAYPIGAVIALLFLSLVSNPAANLEQAVFEEAVVLSTDIVKSDYGYWAMGRVGNSTYFLDLPEGSSGQLGDLLEIDGSVTGVSRRYQGKPAPVVKVRSYSVVDGSTSGYLWLGNSVRSAVQTRLLDGSEARGLLAGFLVGDISDVRDITLAAMRRAGLSHFVAVSGSNVALYLGVVAAVSIPLGLGPKRRAAIGLVSLPVFVVATRFEPSVLRASVMAGLVLTGRLAGLVLETWQVVAAGVTGLVLFDPWLVASAGFQLSVAATCGVIVGARWPSRGGWIARTLLVTAGAQLLVAPLLLVHFGVVPLLSPLTNLISAPLVATASVFAAIGVAGVETLIVPATWMAEWVIMVADDASSWPQLNAIQFVAFVTLGGALALAARRRREFLAVAAAVVVLIAVLAPGRGLEPAQAAVLDVGQGDAILLAGGEGRYALVDGGPDPVLLLEHLRRYGVRGLELVILSHVHADHATGLQGLFDRIPIGQIWMNVEPHETPASRELLDLAATYQVPIRVVGPGNEYSLGELKLDVLGPTRRYASPNDQSVVVVATGRQQSLLLSGDVEVFAQRELTGIKADVLKVPHQGAATSDPGWLASMGAKTAIVSVGPNNFGHPSSWVIELLEASGADVRRTDLEGTIVVDLG